MLSNKQQSKNKGFTIIEVMIVLAIAGLIMLIVFLAVPALQRNARNTSMKSDAAAVAAAVNEFEDNNNGQLPTKVLSDDAGIVAVSGASGTTASSGKVQAGTVAKEGTALPTVTDTVTVVFKTKCNANNNGLGATSSRSTAVVYNTETASGVAPQCLES